MHDDEYIGFVSAMGDEFADALRSVAGDVCGADAYSVARNVSRFRLSPALLASFSLEQIEQLRVAFVRYFEVANDAVTDDAIETGDGTALCLEPNVACGFGFPERLATLKTSEAGGETEEWFIGAVW